MRKKNSNENNLDILSFLFRPELMRKKNKKNIERKRNKKHMRGTSKAIRRGEGFSFGPADFPS